MTRSSALSRAPGELAGELRELGLRAGDVVMVHASLRAVGPVRGGAAGVLEALERAVGPEGTLVMNLGAAEDGEHPFDKDATPADPDVGVLAEVLRTTPGTHVNDHPDARFGARGARAAELLREPLPFDDPYGPGSILERLVEAGGRILRLGADPDTVTLLHLAEYRADVPAKRRVTRRHRVRTADGAVVTRTVSCLDDTDGIAPWPGEDYFASILREYLSEPGRAATGRVGGASSELIDAAGLLDHATAWMSRHLGARQSS
jgi:aminoglycoside N3'-acetyltransferase